MTWKGHWVELRSINPQPLHPPPQDPCFWAILTIAESVQSEPYPRGQAVTWGESLSVTQLEVKKAFQKLSHVAILVMTLQNILVSNNTGRQEDQQRYPDAQHDDQVQPTEESN